MISELKGFLCFSRKAAALLAGHRKRFVALVALSIAAAMTEGVGVTMLVPLLESVGQDSIFAQVPVLGAVSHLFEDLPVADKLRYVALGMFGVVSVRAVITFAVAYGAVALPRAVTKELSDRAYASLMKASLRFLSDENSGVIQNSIINLPRRIGTLLTHFANILVTVCVIMVYLGLMLAISVEMTLASLIFLGIASEAIKRTTHVRANTLGARISALTAWSHQIVYESLNGIRLIHMSVAERKMTDRWTDTSRRTLREMLALDRILLSISPLLAFAAGTLICLLIFVTSFANDSEKMAGKIILFMFLLFRLLAPISSLNTARASIQGDMHALEESERFHARIQASAQVDGTRSFTKLRDGITFENMTFWYPGSEGPTLTGIDLRIPKGSMIALVGPSGAGKSTLVALLTRFYDPGSGRITIDGIDLRDLRLDTWRSRVGMVSQEVTIFNDTVLNNIRFGRDTATVEKVHQAARLAAAEDFINALANGLETVVGERGIRLSGGQQQRIALARAILTDPDLLILDEATSNLDSITERAIHEAVENLRRDRTVIVIAHRLSTVRRADSIIVMEHGRVVESGKHDDLLALGGRYADLIEHQRLDLIEDEAGGLSPVDASPAR